MSTEGGCTSWGVSFVSSSRSRVWHVVGRLLSREKGGPLTPRGTGILDETLRRRPLARTTTARTKDDSPSARKNPPMKRRTSTTQPRLSLAGGGRHALVRADRRRRLADSDFRGGVHFPTRMLLSRPSTPSSSGGLKLAGLLVAGEPRSGVRGRQVSRPRLRQPARDATPAAAGRRLLPRTVHERRSPAVSATTPTRSATERSARVRDQCGHRALDFDGRAAAASRRGRGTQGRAQHCLEADR